MLQLLVWVQAFWKPSKKREFVYLFLKVNCFPPVFSSMYHTHVLLLLETSGWKMFQEIPICAWKGTGKIAVSKLEGKKLKSLMTMDFNFLVFLPQLTLCLKLLSLWKFLLVKLVWFSFGVCYIRTKVTSDSSRVPVSLW